MKKKLQIIFFSLLLGAIATNAQPVITAAGFRPVIGDNYIWQGTKTISPTSSALSNLSGANKVWDFSKLADSGSVHYQSFVSPKGKPYGDSFPNANMILIEAQDNESQFQYIQADNTGWGSMAHINLDTFNGKHQTIESYSPYSPYFIYPMTMGTTYTASHQSTYKDITTNYQNITTGYDTIIGIGYGTLILPSGTYNNVVCKYPPSIG